MEKRRRRRRGVQHTPGERVRGICGGEGLQVLVNNAGVAPKSTRINMVGYWSSFQDDVLIFSLIIVEFITSH